MNDALALLTRIERDLAELRAMLEPRPREPEPATVPEAYLEPCVLAGLLGISEPHVRRLCQRGQRLGVAGIERRGGRWAATTDALKALRAMRV